MAIRVGIVGIGFMAWIHWLAYQKVGGVEVVAISSRDAKRRAGDWTSIKDGNFGPPGEQVDLSSVEAYESIEQLLADENVDLVDICLPPSMHCDAVVASANAGKHVFCEKPLALSLAECDQSMEACRAKDRQLLVGQVLPFFTEFQFSVSAVNSGEYGKLLGGNFKRVISDPTWLTNFYDPKVVGGPLFDLHVHDAHLIRVLFGMPSTVYTAGRTRGSVASYFNSIFRFADPNVSALATCGAIDQQGRPFSHGYEIHLEKATLHFEFAALDDEPETMQMKVLTEDGKVVRPELGDGDPVAGFVREIEEVVKSLSSGESSPLLSGQLARDAIAMCEAQADSLASGEIVSVAG
jgi:predicted dehydrogenase